MIAATIKREIFIGVLDIVALSLRFSLVVFRTLSDRTISFHNTNLDTIKFRKTVRSRLSFLFCVHLTESVLQSTKLKLS